jgi:hypothetical protein
MARVMAYKRLDGVHSQKYDAYLDLFLHVTEGERRRCRRRARIFQGKSTEAGAESEDGDGSAFVVDIGILTVVSKQVRIRNENSDLELERVGFEHARERIDVRPKPEASGSSALVGFILVLREHIRDLARKSYTRDDIPKIFQTCTLPDTFSRPHPRWLAGLGSEMKICVHAALTMRSRMVLPSRVQSFMAGNLNGLCGFPVLDWDSVFTLDALRDEEGLSGMSETVHKFE